MQRVQTIVCTRHTWSHFHAGTIVPGSHHNNLAFPFLTASALGKQTKCRRKDNGQEWLGSLVGKFSLWEQEIRVRFLAEPFDFYVYFAALSI